MTSAIQFAQLLGAPEGAHAEFKEARNQFEFDKLIQYIVALANEGGGTIVFGVTDRRPRRVVGTRAFEEPGRTEAGVVQRLGRRVQIEEYEHEGKRVLIVHVPPRDAGSCWSDRGTYWKRAGEALTPMTDGELQRIHAETVPDLSAQTCEGAVLGDLDPNLIAEFRRRWAGRDRNSRIEAWSDEETLQNSELINGSGMSNAAVILFGTRDALSRLLPQAEIIFEYRSTEAAGPAQDRMEWREGLLLSLDQLWDRINLRNDRQSFQDGLFRSEILTFDEATVREALLNAVSHRDYRLPGSVFIRQFPRRLEIVSPGGFPAGVTPENVLDQQNPRNRRLAEALARCGLIERAGQGVNLMIEQSIRQSKPLPDFAGTGAHEVRLTLRGEVTNPAFLRFLERVGTETLAGFDTRDLLVLDLLQREQPVREDLKGRLPALIQVGLVESLGRGRGTRYLLGRRFHAALGAQGTYTRRRGLDDGANKALLCEHLRRVGALGSPISELQQVLPALSRSQIQRLLRELSAEERVALRGSRRGARWFALEPGPKHNGAPNWS